MRKRRVGQGRWTGMKHDSGGIEGAYQHTGVSGTLPAWVAVLQVRCLRQKHVTHYQGQETGSPPT
jgi:hypothetical protein